MNRHDRRAADARKRRSADFEATADRGRAFGESFVSPEHAYRGVRSLLAKAPLDAVAASDLAASDLSESLRELQRRAVAARGAVVPEHLDAFGWSICLSLAPLADGAPAGAPCVWTLSTQVKPGWPLKKRDFVVLAFLTASLGAPVEPSNQPAWDRAAEGSSFYWIWPESAETGARPS